MLWTNIEFITTITSFQSENATCSTLPWALGKVRVRCEVRKHSGSHRYLRMSRDGQGQEMLMMISEFPGHVRVRTTCDAGDSHEIRSESLRCRSPEAPQKNLLTERAPSRCASATPASRLCSPPCSCLRSCPWASATANCANASTHARPWVQAARIIAGHLRPALPAWIRQARARNSSLLPSRTACRRNRDASFRSSTSRSIACGKELRLRHDPAN